MHGEVHREHSELERWEVHRELKRWCAACTERWRAWRGRWRGAQ